jgi:hypothetical protein
LESRISRSTSVYGIDHASLMIEYDANVPDIT